jgi:hypothetical protein
MGVEVVVQGCVRWESVEADAGGKEAMGWASQTKKRVARRPIRIHHRLGPFPHQYASPVQLALQLTPRAMHTEKGSTYVNGTASTSRSIFSLRNACRLSLSSPLYHALGNSPSASPVPGTMNPSSRLDSGVLRGDAVYARTFMPIAFATRATVPQHVSDYIHNGCVYTRTSCEACDRASPEGEGGSPAVGSAGALFAALRAGPWEREGAVEEGFRQWEAARKERAARRARDRWRGGRAGVLVRCGLRVWKV